MKRVISLILLTAMLTLALASCGETSDVPDGMQLASSSDVDYYFYVPEDWTVDKSTLYSSAYYSSGDQTSISATALAVNVSGQDVSEWFDSFMEEFKTVYTDVSDVTKEEVALDVLDGMKFTFSAKLADTEYDYVIVAASKGYYIYYLTYTSTPDYNEDHLEELDDVVANFKFK